MRRAVAVVAGVLVLLVGIGGLLLVFNARDEAGLDAQAPAGPGTLEEDLGAEHVDIQTEELRLSEQPPTSGPHRDELPTREGRLDDRAILHALEVGDVVFVHDGPPPAELKTLQEELAGPFDAELAAAGQSVILVRRDGAPTQGLAWRRRLVSDDPAQLRAFAEAWLGVGAG